MNLETYTKILYDSTKWNNDYKKINKWAITEKIHGSNFSFVYDVKTNSFKYAKRTGILDDSDNFFGYKTILQETLPKIQLVVDYVKKIYTDLQTITVFGELFGEGVQGGIYYSPNLHFYAFDIFINIDSNTKFYLDFEISLKAFEYAKILHAKPLKIYNSYERAIEHKLGFDSTIPSILNIDIVGLQPGKNKAEGIVVRSMKQRYITKIKIPEFSETKYSANDYDKAITNDNKLESYKTKALQCMTINRLNNAISKIGPFDDYKEEIYEAYANDILSEIDGYGIHGLGEWLDEFIKNNQIAK